MYTEIKLNESDGFGKNEITFLKSALGTDKNKPVFHHIWIDGGRAATSDGRRLHVIESPAFEGLTGFFSVVSIDKSMVTLKQENNNCEFPPIDKVIPSHPHVLNFPAPYSGSDKLRKNLTVSQLLWALDMPVNTLYLSDALNGIAPYEVRFNHDHDPIMLYSVYGSTKRTAVIMPLQISEASDYALARAYVNKTREVNECKH